MKRIFLTVILLIAVCFISAAYSADKKINKKNNKKAANSVLSDLNIYQLGDSEFVIDFKGENLPEPELILSGDKLQFKFLDLKSNLRDFNKNYIETLPLILNYKIQDLSGDLIINIETERPMKLHSRHNNNYTKKNTFRFKQNITDIHSVNFMKPPENTLNIKNLFSKNEKISLELRDVDLRDVFEVFAQYMNKNVIIDESFPSKNVKISFNNIMLFDAVKNFITAYDISYRLLDEDTVIFGSRDGLSRFSGREKLAKIEIAYAEPVELRERLIKLININENKITVDTRTRVLYIRANPEKLDLAGKLIQELDRPNKQIKIHARIFEFSSSYGRELESELNAVYSHWRFNFSGLSGGSIEYIDRSAETILREFDASFRAMEAKGHGKTLASPSVTAINGQEAKISLTEDYPYISERDEAGNSEWSTQTVGPQLFITPNIGRDGLISMKIDISTGDVLEMITGSTGEQMPRISKRSVTTNAILRDGEPFVIGGLFHESKTNRSVGIPILGDIPFIGNLFKYSYKDHNRTQAVILVVPYILDVPDTPVKFQIIE